MHVTHAMHAELYWQAHVRLAVISASVIHLYMCTSQPVCLQGSTRYCRATSNLATARPAAELAPLDVVPACNHVMQSPLAVTSADTGTNNIAVQVINQIRPNIDCCDLSWGQ